MKRGIVRVLQALASETPATIRKGDVIHIIPEKGPRRLMRVGHVEHHMILLADLDGNQQEG